MNHTKLLFIAVILLVAAAFAGMEFTSARIYRDQKEWAKAYDFYSRDLQKNPDNLDGYYERGELLGGLAMDKNKHTALREIFGTTEDPQHTALDKMTADFSVVMSNTSDPKRAGRLQKKIEEILTDYWREFYNHAVTSDSIFTAMVLAGTVTVPEEDSAATAEIADTNAQIALRNADIAILLIPERWNAYALKAQVYDRLNKMETATASWNEALSALNKQRVEKPDDKDLASAWLIIELHLLQNYYNLDWFDKTVSKANEILAVDSLDIDAIQYKAYAISRMANDETKSAEEREVLKSEAISALNKAHVAHPDDAVICYYIGQFYVQLEDTANALKAFQEYLSIDSTDRDVLATVGYFYLEGGSFANSKKAEEYFAKLVVHHPEDGLGWINFGVALIRNGKNEAGAKAIEKGEKLSQ